MAYPTEAVFCHQQVEEDDRQEEEMKMRALLSSFSIVYRNNTVNTLLICCDAYFRLRSYLLFCPNPFSSEDPPWWLWYNWVFSIYRFAVTYAATNVVTRTCVWGWWVIDSISKWKSKINQFEEARTGGLFTYSWAIGLATDVYSEDVSRKVDP